MGRDPRTQLEGESPRAGVGGVRAGAHQIRSVKPLCRCMEEEELLSTDRMHSRYRSCSCWLSLQKNTGTKRQEYGGGMETFGKC